jgi:predicted negative regulator of RcsB-dependent stress response
MTVLVRRRRVCTGLEEAVVKKLIVLVLLAAAGAAAWRKVQSDRAEQALWAEVTDPVK